MSDLPAQTVDECRQCRQRVPRRGSAARFCPHCGFAFVEPSPTPVSPPAPESLKAMRDEAANHLKQIRSHPLERIHSLMLLGYANAMLHLGWRYEQGSGVARNANEAERCYLKSAKLGNIFARARLSEDQLADVVRHEAGVLPHSPPTPVVPLQEHREA